MAKRTSPLEDHLACVPSEEESVERAVAPYRGMTPGERWAAWRGILAEMDRILGSRRPAGDPEFWRRWTDSALGRPE